MRASAILRRQAASRRSVRGGGAHLHRRRHAGGRGHGGDAGARQRDAGGVRIAAGAVTKAGQNRRFAGEDLKAGQVVLRRGQPVRPAELGMIASLGINEVTVTAGCGWPSSRPATSCARSARRSPKARSTTATATRSTACSRASNCEIVDMGVVPDVPQALEKAFTTAAANADVVITSGGVSVGEADYVKQLLDKLGEVLFWKIAMKPGRPLAYGRDRRRALLRPAGNPVAVMVTFYQFVRDALLVLQGRRDVAPMPTFKATLAARSARCPAAPSSSAASSPGRERRSRCARPATRARASCRRCRRPTASSCWRRKPATSPRAKRRRAAPRRLDLTPARV